MWRKYSAVVIIITLMFLFSSCENKNDSNSEESSNRVIVTKDGSPTPVLTEEPMVKGTNTPSMKPTKEPKQTPLGDRIFTIVIDPGHQKKGNSETEPIGPGATETKAKVSSGTQGVSTNIPEYIVNLEVSLKLRDILKERGYRVIMTRETHDVNISNSERAAIANEKEADVFVRIHCNGSEDSSIMGTLTMCPTKNNPYCSQIYQESRSLSEYILEELCEKSGAKNGGIIETDSMSGLNWCKTPVTIVEMGYMSNPNEDKKLTTWEYQDKLAYGIAGGIDNYFESFSH